MATSEVGGRLPLSATFRIAYLGPHGTFSEQALLSEPDLAACRLVETASIADALEAASSGSVDAAFVPIENSLEGPVPATIEGLASIDGWAIHREVDLEIHLDLAGNPGTVLGSIDRVVSFPHAIAQCRRFLADHLDQASIEASNSTADGARRVAEEASTHFAAVASPLAVKLYGLDVLAHAIEDAGSKTRFVLVARSRAV